MQHVTYECRHCGEEIECEVTINEEDDLPETCPACNAPIPLAAHTHVQQAAMERLYDAADRRRDD